MWPTCPVAPNSVHMLPRKIPATGFKTQSKHLSMLPEPFGRVLVLLGLFRVPSAG